MLPYLSMMRPGNAAMSLLAVLIGSLMVLGPAGFAGFLSHGIGLALAAAFLITGAGNVINDYFDVEADKINRPKRPIPSGRVSRRAAAAFSVLLFAAGIWLAAMVNTVALAIAAANSLVLVAYSYRLQDKILVGNIAVSYLVASTFLFGGAAAGNVALPLMLAALAFFSNLSREIVKDMEDLEGDRQSFLKRLAMKAREKVAELAGDRFSISGMETHIRHKKLLHFLAGLSVMLAILVSPAPYLLGMLGQAYLLMLFPTNFFLLLAFFHIASVNYQGSRATRLLGSKGYGRISKLIKLGMLFGLLAFIAGALV